MGQRRGFDAIEHRQPGPGPGAQPGGDRYGRRSAIAGRNTQLGTQSLVTCQAREGSGGHRRDRVIKRVITRSTMSSA